MAMDNEKEKKGPSKMEKLIKYACKLKDTVASRFICTSTQATVVSHPSAVRCDELFRPPNKRCSDQDVDPVVSAYIAAQNHFSLRPNICI